jgi:Cu/Ag efflux protein CusF
MPRKFNSSSQYLAAFCLCTAITLFAACNRGPSQPSSSSPSATNPQTGARRYALKGKVVSVDKQASTANIDNEPIDGFMDAMTMSYPVKPAAAIAQLQPGDSITADVVVQSEKYWLENVKVTAHATPPAGKPAATLLPLFEKRRCG